MSGYGSPWGSPTPSELSAPPSEHAWSAGGWSDDDDDVYDSYRGDGFEPLYSYEYNASPRWSPTPSVYRSESDRSRSSSPVRPLSGWQAARPVARRYEESDSDDDSESSSPGGEDSEDECWSGLWIGEEEYDDDEEFEGENEGEEEYEEEEESENSVSDSDPASSDAQSEWSVDFWDTVDLDDCTVDFGPRTSTVDPDGFRTPWGEMEDHEETPFMPGDLIEIDRRRGLGGRDGIYQHWVLFYGYFPVDGTEREPFVIHSTLFNTPNELTSLNEMELAAHRTPAIRCDPLRAVVGNSQFRVYNDSCSDTRDPTDIVEDASSQIGESGYDWWSNNCEHFVHGCRYGLRFSRQTFDQLRSQNRNGI